MKPPWCGAWTGGVSCWTACNGQIEASGVRGQWHGKVKAERAAEKGWAQATQGCSRYGRPARAEASVCRRRIWTGSACTALADARRCSLTLSGSGMHSCGRQTGFAAARRGVPSSSARCSLGLIGSNLASVSSGARSEVRRAIGNAEGAVARYRRPSGRILVAAAKLASGFHGEFQFPSGFHPSTLPPGCCLSERPPTTTNAVRRNRHPLPSFQFAQTT